MKYRKKPVEVEAVKFRSVEISDPVDQPFSEMNAWLADAISNGNMWFEEATEDYFYCKIKTLEGIMTAAPDDMIIRGISGEIYPCKPEVFEKTYEKVEE